MESNDSPDIPDRGETSDKYINQVWQKEWDEAAIVSNKLREIFPRLSDKQLSFCKTRKEDTIVNSLHVGLSCFTHSFLLKKKKSLLFLLHVIQL